MGMAVSISAADTVSLDAEEPWNVNLWLKNVQAYCITLTFGSLYNEVALATPLN